MYTGSTARISPGVARIIPLHVAKTETVPTTHTRKKIALPVADGVRVVNIDDITHCASEGNYCNVHLASGQCILLAKTLKWVTEKLPASEFIRAHASFLVAISRISFFSQSEIRLENDQAIPISRQRKAAVREALLREFA